MDRHEVPALVAFLAQVPDCRQRQGRRHPLLALACVATLGGARSERAIVEWISIHGEPWRRRLGFTRAIGPSQATLLWVSAAVDVTAVEAALSQWAQAVVAGLPTAGYAVMLS